jgi:uncharacterized protein (TIGR02217 family)
MSGFHEIQFPAGISQGATGGPRVSTGLRTQEQIEQLLDFFHAREGKAYGFRFKDWGDYRVPRWRYTPGDMGGYPVMFTTDGTTATFQMKKVYGDSGNAYVRLIQKPVAGTFQFFNNGVQMTYTTDYTLDLTTGIVTLSNAIKGTTGRSIAGYSEFDVPVRFDTDDMKITTTTTEIYAWNAVPIVEIRDVT